MNYGIKLLTTRRDELLLKAQPYLDQLSQDPLSKEYVNTDTQRGLSLKEESSFFSDEERAFFKELTQFSSTADEMKRQYQQKRERVLEEIESREMYSDALQASDSQPLDRALKEATADYDTAEEALADGNSIIEKLQLLGWIRYMDSFKTPKGKPDYGRAKKEINKMINSISIVDTADCLRSESAREVFKSVPKSMLIEIDTKNYTSGRRAIITPTNFSAMSEADSKEYYRMVIEPHFFYHLKAIERMGLPLKEANSLIDNAIDSLLAQLKDAIITASTDLVIAGKDQPLVRLPVERFSYSPTELSRKLFSGKYRNEKPEQITIFDMEVAEGEKRSVNTYLTVSYKDLKGITGIEDLTPEQEGIYDAIASEWNAGNRFVTTRMIHKTRMGGDSTAKLTPKQKEEYDKFIDESRRRTVKINNREFAEARGSDEFVSIDTNLLNMAKVENITMDGKVLDEVWIIKERPVLNAYADAIGQGRDVDIKLLRTGTSANYIPLRDYLLKQILYMKQGNRSHKILFDTIYKTLYSDPDRKMKKRIRENAYAMLDYWITQDEIYSYLPSESEGSVTIFFEGEKVPRKAETIRKTVPERAKKKVGKNDPLGRK